MSVVRRVYVYCVAFVSLLMLAGGLSGLGEVLIEAPTISSGTASAQGLREALTLNVALVLVGLPVWLLHWVMAERAARRDPSERGATLRRLYVYAVLLVMALRLAWSGHELLAALLARLLPGAAGADAAEILRPLPWLLVAGLLWLYHRRVMLADRRLAGEEGGSATLRRWYRYGLAALGLLVLLSGMSGVLRLSWEAAVGALAADRLSWGAPQPAGPLASMLVGLLLWLSHWQGWATRSDAERSQEEDLQDVRSTLRPTYLFLALGLAIGFTLTAAAQMLYYGLGRALGVERPGGVGGNLAVALAGPGSTLIVYGLSWLYHRQALAAQATAQPELPRQAGVRRLYTYLVAIIAVVLVNTGAGGLLWTLADLLTNAQRSAGGTDWWREQVSLFATLLIVGLPVWVAYWGRVADLRRVPIPLPEVTSLSRRLYLYLILLAGVLVLLGAGATAAKQILDLILGETATAGATTNLARALAVATVAGLSVFGHQRVLRRDQALATAALPAADAATPAEAGAAETEARTYGVIYRQGQDERHEWFPSAQAARSAYHQRLTEADGAAWVALVHVLDQTTRAPSPRPRGEGA